MKSPHRIGFVTGHDFSRAENTAIIYAGFSPCKSLLTTDPEGAGAFRPLNTPLNDSGFSRGPFAPPTEAR